MKLKIGKKQFDVHIAEDDAARAHGLKGIQKIPKGKGLVLKWDEPIDVSITMEGVNIPLGLVFASGGKVQEVREARVGQPDIMIRKPSDMVFEGNTEELKDIRKGDEISLVGTKEEGGTISFLEDVVPAEGNLHILDDKGIVQGNLQGNERVFSRIHTKQLYKLADKVGSNPSNTSYRALGKAIVRMINKQDIQEPEYSID